MISRRNFNIDNNLMITVLTIYATTLGNTQAMADAINQGVQSVAEVEAIQKSTDQVSIEDVRNCQGLIIGTPVRHRSADARIKKVIEDTLEVLWLTDEMVGKVGGVFSVGGGYGNMGAGCELTQLGILNAMAASGMILVPLPKTTPGFEVAGMHWGPSGRSGGPKMEPIGITPEMTTAGFPRR